MAYRFGFASRSFLLKRYPLVIALFIFFGFFTYSKYSLALNQLSFNFEFSDVSKTQMISGDYLSENMHLLSGIHLGGTKAEINDDQSNLSYQIYGYDLSVNLAMTTKLNIELGQSITETSSFLAQDKSYYAALNLIKNWGQWGFGIKSGHYQQQVTFNLLNRSYNVDYGIDSQSYFANVVLTSVPSFEFIFDFESTQFFKEKSQIETLATSQLIQSQSPYLMSSLWGLVESRFYIEGIFLINSQHEVSLGFEQQQSWVDLQRYNFAKLAWNLYDLSPTFRALFDDGSINLGISYQKMLTDQDSSTQGSADNGILGLHCNFKF